MVYILPDSRVGRVYRFLSSIGRSATIAEIVEGIEESPVAWRIAGVRNSINAYAVKGRLFSRPSKGLVGLADTEVSFGCRPPAEGGVTDVMRSRARVRIMRALYPGRGVMTPAGMVFTRPNCQWCYAPAWKGVKWSRYDRRQSDIEAWHILKYGTAANDLFVIFLCPRCARLFSAREVNPLNLIAERFSVNLQKNQSSPQIAAFMRELASVTSDYARQNS